MIHPSITLKTPSVDFDEKKHVYRNRQTGEFYVSCSTVSDAWDKSYFLGPWYAKEMAKFLEPEYKEVQKMDEKEYKKFITYAKSAAKRKSEQAKLDGSAAHKWIQEFIQGEISGSFDFPVLPESDESRAAILAFDTWAQKQDIKWLASEMIVCSDKYKVAGMLDGLAIVNGVASILDFKTSSQIGAGYLLQCAGYDLMLDEMGYSVVQYVIIRIPKDGTDAETLTISDPKEIGFLKETFLHQRAAHKFYSFVESKLKENGKIKVDESNN